VSAAASLSDDLRAMAASRVFVAGDILLDVHVVGAVRRVSPEAPVPVVLEESRRATLGGAGNVAAGVAAMGAEAHLAGRVGDDADADMVASLCAEAGIACAGVVRSQAVPTTRKMRILAGYQQIVRVDRERTDPCADGDRAAVQAAFAGFLAGGGARCLILSDYAKGMLAPDLIEALLGMASAAGVPAVVDPKAPTFARYRGATIVKPNAAEGRAALRRAEPVPVPRAEDDEDLAICTAVIAESGAENVVLSLSERGVMALGAAAPGGVRRDSHALSVADVSGAGDTMVALLAMGAAASLPFERTVETANVAAGAVCGRLGTVALTPAELLAVAGRRPETPAAEKTLASDAQVRWIGGQLRAEGRTIAFANGCFDLLHAGHVTLLQRARALADVLVVGLNSDASVTRLKGPGRPVQPAADRATVLAGLACVDWVAVFEEDTPLELITALRPDVIVKGGDYTPETVVGNAEARAWGGRVEIVPLVEGLSTTRLLEAGAR
jgi:D-beta-D-heptose 7-phosphate kinase / D-beta-D-heptose 1-phosphate adenosyltransferase